MLLQISEPGASTPKAACRERVVGIDLGTTNSLVATVLDAQPTVLTGGADAIVPSVVSYDGAEAVVGRAAVARGEANPVDTVASVKRLMGRSLADVAAVAPLTMGWCLDCHRDPVPNLRPREEVTNVLWQPPADLAAKQKEWALANNVQSKVSCSNCHR